MNVQIRRYSHLLLQVLAQGAVIAIVPAPAVPYVAALVAILGVVVAFNDETAGMAKAQANMQATGNIMGNR